MTFSSGNYSITTDGLRYRFKRSYSEMYSELSNQSKEMHLKEEAKLTPNNLFRPHLNSTKDNNNTSNLFLNSNPLIQSNKIVQSNQGNKIDKAFESKTLIVQQSSQLYSRISSLESLFTTQKIPLFVRLLNKYCTKIIKNKSIKNQKCKSNITFHLIVYIVVNLFKKSNFVIEKTYSNNTKEINAYLLLIDTLISKNIFYEFLLNSKSKIGNLLLYYLSQIMLIDIGKKVISTINFNIDKVIISLIISVLIMLLS